MTTKAMIFGAVAGACTGFVWDASNFSLIDTYNDMKLSYLERQISSINELPQFTHRNVAGNFEFDGEYLSDSYEAFSKLFQPYLQAYIDRYPEEL